MRKIKITRRQSIILRSLTGSEIVVQKKGLSILISLLPERTFMLSILDSDKENSEWDYMIITEGTEKRWLKTIEFMCDMTTDEEEEVKYFMPQEKIYIGGTHDNV